MRQVSRLLVVVAALALPAQAQERRPAAAPPPPASPPPAVLPSQTTATYGDWIHRCVRLAADQPQQTCEILLQVQAAQGGQVATLMNLAIGRAAPQQPLILTVQLPVNVSFSAQPSLVVEGAPPAELRFARCAAGACFATAAATDAVLGRLRDKAEAGARVEFRNAAEAPVTIPVSLNGFAQALDALQTRR
jgi:invasion protein IalB